jgi:hypothetical protein
MIRLFLSALFLLAATAAEAARPSTLGMTCDQAQRLLASRGAVVMSTGQHTYNRFVVSGGYCEVAEWAESATAPTKDARHCPLGYTCTSTPPFEYDAPGDHWLLDR